MEQVKTSDNVAKKAKHKSGAKKKHTGTNTPDSKAVPAAQTSPAENASVETSPKFATPPAQCRPCRGLCMLVGVLVGVIAVLLGTAPTPVATAADTVFLLSQALSSRETLSTLVSNLPPGPPRDSLLDLLATLPEPLESIDSRRPGLRAAHDNVTAKHPVILVPGFISSGLELWKGKQCADGFFRYRMWGTASMVDMATRKTSCWLDTLEYDALYGLDRDGIKLRAAQGFEASDYVIGRMWLWSQMIENLVDIGYTSNDMYLASYDWRLPFIKLEERDRYFTKLRFHIELLKAHSGHKVLVVAHSMGSNVWTYFMGWVSAPKSQGGGGMPPSWIEDHVYSVAFIGGPHLGAVNVVGGMVMGEKKEFSYFSGRVGQRLNAIISPGRRRRLFRSFGSSHNLLPIGGEAVWGDLDSAPDDPPIIGELPRRFSPHGAMLQQLAADGSLQPYHAYSTVSQIVQRLHSDAKRSQEASNETSGLRFKLWADQRAPRSLQPAPEFPPDASWANPLRTSLPFAPSLTLACLYGVGVPTERAYVVSEEAATEQPFEELPEGDRVPFLIDRNANDAAANLSRGVYNSDGDGTVPLVSLGYMCARGWRGKQSNPGRSRLLTREYLDEPTLMDDLFRGNTKSSNHMDILGNYEVIADIITLASGSGDTLKDRIVSEIERIAEAVDARLDYEA
eukprot:gb/GEZN01002738.1/.p1 GENE.gb/GEZN01002738.1/~~gb/GEZN01002738.1/.p1  ORF type:complete len:679 (-),score=69.29 gb/GEZN01002738.1/:229-2265(-)